ncbi:hypothetical protein fugu_003083 [Takifugu bimaculatus]|uniref:TauD/TfdA-like domain-containing protein n=1 Tax=Takifugu bimaculatus TaxID=433685 RepID=A0A4Z2BEJ4_9TELE|nr:hypothetical protein fugu_003083 [Takifugu bimaculatus]
MRRGWWRWSGRMEAAVCTPSPGSETTVSVHCVPWTRLRRGSCCCPTLISTPGLMPSSSPAMATCPLCGRRSTPASFRQTGCRDAVSLQLPDGPYRKSFSSMSGFIGMQPFRCPRPTSTEVLHDDKAALAWLLALRRVGIVYLRGAPAEEGQVARLVERIGYLRLTFYGHTWHVKDKPMANNVAYTSGMLIVHTDYPALHFAPGVQFLHCISQAAEGGESQVVDGFHMAEQLRKEDPEAFRILTSTLVDFTDTGEDYCDFMLQSKKCIIDVDLEGRVKGINYNNCHQRLGAGPARRPGPALLQSSEDICGHHDPAREHGHLPDGVW